jgi:hypothetical protein
MVVVLPVFQSEALNIAAVALIAVWSFPAWAERMLSLKERWESHRRRRADT